MALMGSEYGDIRLNMSYTRSLVPIYDSKHIPYLRTLGSSALQTYTFVGYPTLLWS